MKKIVYIQALALCVLLAGCRGAAPGSKPGLNQKTAILCTNMTTGTASPDIREHTWEYTGELGAAALADALSALTGLDLTISASEAAGGVTVDWKANSTLIANLDNREQKEAFRFFDAESMRWFMMDSLWLTLKKNLKIENVYYSMDGGKDLSFETLQPVKTFPADLPYMGSAFFAAHANGRGEPAGMNQVDAEETVREKLADWGKDDLMTAGGGEDTVDGEHAIIVTAGHKSADGKSFTAVYDFAVTDSGAVFYREVLKSTEWKNADEERKR